MYFQYNAALLYFVAIGVWVLLRVFRSSRERKPYFWRELHLYLFFFYLCYLFWATLEPFIVPVTPNPSLDSINWVPFRGMLGMVSTAQRLQDETTTRVVLINLVGNVLVFIPIGYLAAVLWKPQRALMRDLAMGLGISFGIELTQFFLAVRVADVDDLLLNGLGTLLGFGLFHMLHLIPPIRRWYARIAEAERPKAGLWAAVYLLLVMGTFAGIYYLQIKTHWGWM